MWDVKKYDEELFTNLFDVTNKIKIKKICIELDDELLSNEIFVKNICRKIFKKIRSLETQFIISNEVSCFIKLCLVVLFSLTYKLLIFDC